MERRDPGIPLLMALSTEATRTLLSRLLFFKEGFQLGRRVGLQLSRKAGIKSHSTSSLVNLFPLAVPLLWKASPFLVFLYAPSIFVFFYYWKMAFSTWGRKLFKIPGFQNCTLETVYNLVQMITTRSG